MRRDLGLHPRKLVRKSEHVQVVAVVVVSRGSVDIGIGSTIGIVNVTLTLWLLLKVMIVHIVRCIIWLFGVGTCVLGLIIWSTWIEIT